MYKSTVFRSGVPQDFKGIVSNEIVFSGEKLDYLDALEQSLQTSKVVETQKEDDDYEFEPSPTPSPKPASTPSVPPKGRGRAKGKTKAKRGRGRPRKT